MELFLSVALWLLVVVAGLLSLYLLVVFLWAARMLLRVARGDFGDLNDVGGHDGGVQAEP